MNPREVVCLSSVLAYASMAVIWPFRGEFPHEVIVFSILIATLFLSYGFLRPQKGRYRLVSWYALLSLLLLTSVFPYVIVDDYLVNPLRDPQYQNIEQAATFSLQCAGFIAGMYLGASLINNVAAPARAKALSLGPKAFLVLGVSSVALSAWYHPADSIFFAGYGEVELRGPSGFAMIEGVYGILILVMYVDLLMNFSKLKAWVWLVTLFLAVIWFSFLRGFRVEGFGLMLSIFLVNRTIMVNAPQLAHDTEICRRINSVAIYGLAVLLPLGLLLGMVRSAPLDTWAQVLSDVFGDVGASVSAFKSALVGIVSLLGTWLDVSYAGMVFTSAIEAGTLKFAFLEHYFDIVGATLPEFLDPDRPPALSSIVKTVSDTGGGMALPATFIEGGLVQMMLVSVTYGAVLSWFSIRQKNFFSLLVCGILCAASFRTVLYGEQSLYKYFIALLVIWMTLRVFGLVNVRRHSAPRLRDIARIQNSLNGASAL